MEELPLTASQEVFSHPRLDEIAKVHRGVIDGAHFCVASPLSGENNCLLIHCHGFRPENTEPFAEIDDSFWLRLVQQGWTVGVTSYRRNGIVVQDAIRDVLNLRNWVCCEIGLPAWVFLDGRSMGGAISTRIAELPNAKTLFKGVLAIGAALLVKEEGSLLKYRPTIPIIYLTNVSEHGPILDYISKVSANAEEDRKRGDFGGDEIITPALHAVNREGHNWTNSRERWRAFSCLVEWAFVGSLVTEFRFDGTRAAGLPARVAPEINQGQLTATVTHIEDKTTFHLNIKLSDLDAIGVRMNNTCLMNGDKVIYLSSYPFVGVPQTAVVLSETPEDFLCLFAMSEFRNKPAVAVLELGLNVGDKIIFKAVPEPPRTFKRKAMPPPIQLE